MFTKLLEYKRATTIIVVKIIPYVNVVLRSGLKELRPKLIIPVSYRLESAIDPGYLIRSNTLRKVPVRLNTTQ